MGLTLHPVPGKEKSRLIVKAFAAGAPRHATGAVFFGTEGLLDVFRQAKSGTWYYCDNSYFDRCRGTYFRVTKNALQVDTVGKTSSGDRFRRLGVAIKPWRTELGRDLLLCPQSDLFMKTAFGRPFDWAGDAVRRLQDMGNTHPVRVRPWSSNKLALAAALLDELPRLRMLITWSSASAITAMLQGVPAISESGAAHALTGPLSPQALENPPRPEGRELFAHVLADHQFTLDEFRDGTAWRALNP